ncbi:MAG: hypothetical protein IPO27_12945 [Bacteroidetes bacterium]|nr:hypothetical protein [Bacteroidota bacterium]
MKKFLLLSLVGIMMLSAFRHTMIFVHYLINKQTYATVLCEDKAKPKMNCYGKCHMMKEMKEQDKKDQGPTSSAKEKNETVQFFQKNIHFPFSACFEITKYDSFFLLRKAQSVSFSIFHPPTV